MNIEQNINIPLSSDHLDKLLQSLDKNEDGEVDYKYNIKAKYFPTRVFPT